MSRYLSCKDLETIADGIFREYSGLPGAYEDGRLLYVDPALLLKELLGLTVEYRHLSQDRTVLGVTAYDEIGVELCDEEEDLFFFDGKTVLVETDLLEGGQTGRHNFTVVHEGCHHVLKTLFPEDYAGSVDERRVLRYRDLRGRRSREEWQVDYLASSVLMPRELVENAMRITGQEGKINVLNPVWRKIEYERFLNVCWLLGVSKQALSIRMRRLGLLGEDQRRRPERILDVF